MRSTPFSEGKKVVAILLVRGWSCPGYSLAHMIPCKGWQAPDGRKNIELIDALKEESLWVDPYERTTND
jgi:hypothetical protein